MSVDGKTVVITGGEGPLGRAVTRKFLSEGARIIIGWNNPEKWVKPPDVADFLLRLCADECDVLSGSLLKLFAKV